MEKIDFVLTFNNVTYVLQIYVLRKITFNKNPIYPGVDS